MLTEKQKQKRHGLITSSVAAAALGLTPTKMTSLQAWMRVLREDIDEPKNSRAIERGNALENIVLDYPVKELSLERQDAPFVTHDCGWAGDSADAIYFDSSGEMSVGEAKTVSFGASHEYGDEYTDDIPSAALIQSHWHLLHWPRAQKCFVPVLIGGYDFEFRIYCVDRDENFEGMIFEELEKWHRDYVVTRKPPPMTCGEYDKEWLLKKYPVSSLEMMADTPEIEMLARQKDKASREKKEAIEKEEEAKNKIRAILGDYCGVKAHWGSISYKSRNAAEKTDWKAISEMLLKAREDAEHIINRFTTKTQQTRTLRVTLKG